MLFDDEPKKPAGRLIGADLAEVSIEDLRDYVDDLEAEIERVRQEIERKQRQKQGAEALFRS